MAGLNEAAWAVELPNNAPSIGNVLQSGIALNERRQERNDSILERQREFNQRTALAQEEKNKSNRLHNINSINKATEYGQYATADEHINDVARNTLYGIKDQALKYADSDPAEMETYIGNSMKEFINWHSAAQTDLANAKTQIADANKTYPNARLTDLNTIADNSILKKYITTDANGRPIPLSYNQISKNKTNHLDLLNNQDVLANVINDTSNIQKFYHGLEKNQVHDSDYVNNKGFVNRTKWSTIIAPGLTEIVPDKNGDPIVDVKNQEISAIKDADGNPMKIVSNDVYKTMMGEPSRAASFIKIYKESDDYKKMNDASIKKTGKPMDESTNDIMFRHFLYNDAKSALPNIINHDKVEKIPAPRITVNVGGKEAAFNDYNSSIIKKLEGKKTHLPINELTPGEQGVVLKIARDSFGDISVPLLDEKGKPEYDANDRQKFTKRPLNQSDIAIVRDANGKPQIAKVMDNKVTDYIAPLDYIDVNSAGNNTVKQKQQIIKTAPNGTYKYNGKTFTEAQLEDAAKKSGMSVAEYKKALKL